MNDRRTIRGNYESIYCAYRELVLCRRDILYSEGVCFSSRNGDAVRIRTTGILNSIDINGANISSPRAQISNSQVGSAGIPESDILDDWPFITLFPSG